MPLERLVRRRIAHRVVRWRFAARLHAMVPRSLRLIASLSTVQFILLRSDWYGIAYKCMDMQSHMEVCRQTDVYTIAVTDMCVCECVG